MASVLGGVGREREKVGYALFFFFFFYNQKQRRMHGKKHDEKQSLHELKAERGRRGRQAETNKQTTTDEQLQRALQ